MKNQLLLHDLMNPIRDLDSFAYEYVRTKIQEGFWVKLDTYIIEQLAERDNSVLTIFSFLTIRVQSTLFSSIMNYEPTIRKRCNSIHYFKDETIEFDIFIKDHNEYFGKRKISQDSITRATTEQCEEVESIFMNQDFKNRLISSNDVFVYFKIPHFSSDRINREKQECLLEPELYFQKINNHYISLFDSFFVEGKENVVYVRSQCFGYTEDYWKKHLIGVNIIDWVDSALSLYKLPFNYIGHLDYFIEHFSNLEIKNETIMKKNDIIKKYEGQVLSLVKSIDETDRLDFLK